MRISDWSSDVCSSDLQTANGVGTSGLDVATEHALQRVDRQPAGTFVCLRTDRLPILLLVMELVLDAAEDRLENVLERDEADHGVELVGDQRQMRQPAPEATEQ